MKKEILIIGGGTAGRWSMWLVKAHLLPMMYWEGMLKGRA